MESGQLLVILDVVGADLLPRDGVLVRLRVSP